MNTCGLNGCVFKLTCSHGDNLSEGSDIRSLLILPLSSPTPSTGPIQYFLNTYYVPAVPWKQMQERPPCSSLIANKDRTTTGRIPLLPSPLHARRPTFLAFNLGSGI